MEIDTKPACPHPPTKQPKNNFKPQTIATLHLISSSPQRPHNSLRVAVYHFQIRPRRSLWVALALFPMAQRVDAEAEALGEGFLRHSRLGADRPDVEDFGLVGQTQIFSSKRSTGSR